MSYFKRNIPGSEESSTLSVVTVKGSSDVSLYTHDDMTFTSGSLLYDSNAMWYYSLSGVFYWDINLKSNTPYNLSWDYEGFNNRGIAIITIWDPTDTTTLYTFDSVDMYAASSQYANFPSEDFIINYLPGIHTFRLRVSVTTKNASSSNYYIVMPHIWKIREQ